MVIWAWSDAAVQGPTPSGSLVVKKNGSTTPFVSSDGLGLYRAVEIDVALLIVPPPVGTDQVTELAEPPKLIVASPLLRFIGFPAQKVLSTPALTVALRLIVTITTSEATRHGPAPSGSFVVSRRVTARAAISMGDGV